MSRNDTESFLNRFINLERNPFIPYPLKLERVIHLLGLLGHPERSGMKFLIVAGSKGKGSTAAMMSSIFERLGLKTGLYTSPHLVSWQERIRINGRRIPLENAGGITDLLERLVERNPFPYGLPTYFEMMTAMAIVYFFQERCEVCVLEVGLGGTFDATNACPAILSVITPIGFEHERILGPSLRDIVRAKSGVIKPHGAVVTALQRPEVLAWIKEQAQAQKARFFSVQDDLEITETRIEEDLQEFWIQGPWGNEGPFEIPLLGRHQIENAATAYLACRCFYERLGMRVPLCPFQEGFRGVVWPGRLEKISDTPRIIVDGAHTPESAEALRLGLERHFHFDRLHLIFGMMRDKNPEGFLEGFRRWDPVISIAEIPHERSFKSDELLPRVQAMGFCARRLGSLPEGMETVTKECRESDLLVITGSLYLVGEVKRIYEVATV